MADRVTCYTDDGQYSVVVDAKQLEDTANAIKAVHPSVQEMRQYMHQVAVPAEAFGQIPGCARTAPLPPNERDSTMSSERSV